MSKFNFFLVPLALACNAVIPPVHAATNELYPDDQALAAYFQTQTAKISASAFSDIHSLADWQARRPALRRQAAEMLGLDPIPVRTDLSPVITGRLEREDFTVENLYFQSRPHLYVTANLYLPKKLSPPVPAVLYLCGHTQVISNGVSFGNKTAYQHHGIWFARNGYACLVLDTLQWGEILGRHHGTFDEGQWWWNSRGYTPAGVEIWNAIRALDYLSTRPEVDPARLGVTGRSGGGAYSWFLAALDDRVKVIAPVSGLTDLRNYVVDGASDNHCDCMFFINTYRWDYPLLAALCAPRPLLLVNADADSLFPLDGVMRTHDAVKRIYDLYGASKNFGLVIGPGPHKDTQDIQVPVFHWFNSRLLRKDDLIATAAIKMFSPAELKVFDKIPADQINTTIQDTFVPAAPRPDVPATPESWQHMKENWMRALREKCFAGWPLDASLPGVTRILSEKSDGILYETYEIQSQPDVTLRLYLMRKARGSKPREVILRVADSSLPNSNPNTSAASHAQSFFGRPEDVAALIAQVKKENVAHAVFLPRGIGPTAWGDNPAYQTHVRRRFMLLGQTLDGMRVWDIRRAIQALHLLKDYRQSPQTIGADGDMGVNTLYAALFEPGIKSLDLHHLPASHLQGPDYLNVLKYLDMPQTAAMAAERCEVRLQFDQVEGLDFLRAMASSPAAHLKLELAK
jgi:dienelactone hydrolase